MLMTNKPLIAIAVGVIVIMMTGTAYADLIDSSEYSKDRLVKRILNTMDALVNGHNDQETRINTLEKTITDLNKRIISMEATIAESETTAIVTADGEVNLKPLEDRVTKVETSILQMEVSSTSTEIDLTPIEDEIDEIQAMMILMEEPVQQVVGEVDLGPLEARVSDLENNDHHPQLSHYNTGEAVIWLAGETKTAKVFCGDGDRAISVNLLQSSGPVGSFVTGTVHSSSETVTVSAKNIGTQDITMEIVAICITDLP